MSFQKRLLKDICKRCAKRLFTFLNMEGNRNIQSSFAGGVEGMHPSSTGQKGLYPEGGDL